MIESLIAVASLVTGVALGRRRRPVSHREGLVALARVHRRVGR